MLAFSPGLPTGYNIFLTVLSLFAAIVLTGIGLATALSRRIDGARWLGGAIVGGGIAAMHYTGMAAFEVAGRVVWDPMLVAVSIALGALIGQPRCRPGCATTPSDRRSTAALLLTAAICSHHFTAMAAAAIMPDPSIEVPESAIPTELARGRRGARFLHDPPPRACRPRRGHSRAPSSRAGDGPHARSGERGGGGTAGLRRQLDRDRQQQFRRADRRKAPTDVAGRMLADFLPDEAARARASRRPREPIETTLRQCDGTKIPVEIILRPVDFAGKPQQCGRRARPARPQEGREHIRFLAHHDMLTGLPNRNTFNARLDEEIAGASEHRQALGGALPRSRPLQGGQRPLRPCRRRSLLQTVAKCVTSVLEEHQMMARLGGDEFAVIAPGISVRRAGRHRREHPRRHAHRKRGAATAALLSTSIGIAIFPNDALDRTRRCSTTPTPRSIAPRPKAAGPTASSRSRWARRCASGACIEHDLRHAISRRELRLVYQPQTRIDTKRGRRLRSAAAMGSSRARRNVALGLHPDRGGDRPDPADRRVGAARPPAARRPAGRGRSASP